MGPPPLAAQPTRRRLFLADDDQRTARKLEPTEYSLLTMIPVGVQPNGIAVKAFMANRPKRNQP